MKLLLCVSNVVRYLVVVINKMDDPTVEWARSRFDECVTKIRPFLRLQCGYAVKKEVKFIPISGLSGANVKDQVKIFVRCLPLFAVLEIGKWFFHVVSGRALELCRALLRG